MRNKRITYIAVITITIMCCLGFMEFYHNSMLKQSTRKSIEMAQVQMHYYNTVNALNQITRSNDPNLVASIDIKINNHNNAFLAIKEKFSLKVNNSIKSQKDLSVLSTMQSEIQNEVTLKIENLENEMKTLRSRLMIMRVILIPIFLILVIYLVMKIGKIKILR